MSTSVRRVIPDMEKEILEIMNREGISWTSAMKIWYNRMKGNTTKWRTL